MPPNNSQYNQPPINPGAPQPGQVPAQGYPAMPPQQQPMQPMPQQPIAGSSQSAAHNLSCASAKNLNSTQNTLQFSEVRDGMVIMNDGSVRAVIACKSINFDLMSDREREGVEYSYQNFPLTSQFKFCSLTAC